MRCALLGPASLHVVERSYSRTTTTTQTGIDLRPLPLGELLDRAFHLYFKHFVLFVALLAVVMVPYALVAYFQSRDALDAMLSIFTQATQSPGSSQPSPDQLQKLSQLNGVNGWFGLQMAITFLALPLANAAVVVAMSRLYLGLPAGFADSYRAAAQRWLAVLILVILWVVVFVLGVLGFAVLAGIIAAAIGLVSVGLHGSTLAGLLLAVLLIAVTFALIALGVMLYLTVALSFVAVVVERIDPVKAFSSAFRRVFAPGQTWRSVALALSLFLIQLAVTAVGYGIGGLLSYFLKSPALYIVFLSLISLVYAPFALLAIGVFYYDVRMRREGFDLQMLADQMSAARPAVPGTPA